MRTRERVSRRGFLRRSATAAAGAGAIALLGLPATGSVVADSVRVAQTQGGYCAWNGAFGVDPGSVLPAGSAAWRWNQLRQRWEAHPVGAPELQMFTTLDPRAFFLSQPPTDPRFVVTPGGVEIANAPTSVQLVPGDNLLVYQGADMAPVAEVLQAAEGAVRSLTRADNATGDVETYSAGVASQVLGSAQTLQALRAGGVYSARSDRLVHVGMPFQSGLLRGVEASAATGVSGAGTTTLMQGTFEGAEYFVNQGAPLLPATHRAGVRGAG